MPLPIDRLARAGATPAELEHMAALPEVEVESIAHRLEQVAESGVLMFVEEYRGLMVIPPEPKPEPAAADDAPEPEKPAEKPKARAKSANDDAS